MTRPRIPQARKSTWKGPNKPGVAARNVDNAFNSESKGAQGTDGLGNSASTHNQKLKLPPHEQKKRIIGLK